MLRIGSQDDRLLVTVLVLEEHPLGSGSEAAFAGPYLAPFSMQIETVFRSSIETFDIIIVAVRHFQLPSICSLLQSEHVHQ